MKANRLIPLLMMLLWALCPAGTAHAQTQDWTVDPSAYDGSMSVTAAVVLGGTRADHPGDLLAAFADGGSEVRGVAAPTVLDGQSVFFLLLYANDDETPTLSFEFYDAATGSTHLLANTLAFERDAAFGSPTAPYVFSDGETTGAPNWTFDPTGFSAAMLVTGGVYGEGRPFVHPGDTLAAFVDDELRGLAPVTTVGGQTLFFLTVHGDDGDGTVSFQIYDAATGLVRDLAQTLAFEAGAAHGTPSAPFFWNLGAQFGQPAWEDDLDALDTVALATMSLVAAVYADGVRAAHPGDLVAAFVDDGGGPEVRGVAAPTFIDGRAVFFLTIHGTDGETVTFETYAFDPEDGKQKQQALTQFLVFSAGAVTGLASAPVALGTGVAPAEDPEGWLIGFDPSGFAASMAVVGTLRIESRFVGETLVEDVVADHPGDLVAAFVDGDGGPELRGVATPTLVGGVPTFFLQIHADTGGETVTFKAYYAAADTVLTLPESLVFAENTVVGTTGQPYLWQGPPLPLVFTVETEGLDGTMDVNGEIVLDESTTAAGKSDGVASVGVGDQVVAFVGGDARGLTQITEGTGGALVFSMTLAGNNDETVFFKTYAPGTNALLVVDETVPFANGTEVGDADNPVPLTASQPIQADVRALLEGAYDAEGRMTTHLAAMGLIPLAQPFSEAIFAGTPLAHPGTETLLSVPPNAVDWVLVELRTGTSAATKVATRAALMLADGRVVHTDVASPVRFKGVAPGDYYLVVRHRNHLPAMSALRVKLGPGPVRYDFTVAQSQAAGVNAQGLVAPGAFAFYSGDGNASGGVTATDNALWETANGTAGYFLTDFDLSGGVTATDHAAWLSNNGKGSQVAE